MSDEAGLRAEVERLRAARHRAVEEVRQHRTAQVLLMNELDVLDSPVAVARAVVDRLAGLRAELARLRGELVRLADAIECGDLGLGGDVVMYAHTLRDLAASEAA